MRWIIALVTLVVIVVAYVVADAVVRDHVQADIAARIEANEPGTHAAVQIHSWPFTGRLAVSGQVEQLDAQVTGLSVAGVAVSSVDLDVRHLTVDRGQLLDGTVVLQTVTVATVVATVTQSALDSATGLPVTLGDGTVGLDGIQVPATVSIDAGRLDIGVLGLHTLSLPLLPTSLLPCTPSGSVVPGALVLSCTTSTIPAALVQAVAGHPVATSPPSPASP